MFFQTLDFTSLGVHTLTLAQTEPKGSEDTQIKMAPHSEKQHVSEMTQNGLSLSTKMYSTASEITQIL